jgi:hypothetical protein
LEAFTWYLEAWEAEGRGRSSPAEKVQNRLLINVDMPGQRHDVPNKCPFIFSMHSTLSLAEFTMSRPSSEGDT